MVSLVLPSSVQGIDEFAPKTHEKGSRGIIIWLTPLERDFEPQSVENNQSLEQNKKGSAPLFLIFGCNKGLTPLSEPLPYIPPG